MGKKKGRQAPGLGTRAESSGKNLLARKSNHACNRGTQSRSQGATVGQICGRKQKTLLSATGSLIKAKQIDRAVMDQKKGNVLFNPLQLAFKAFPQPIVISLTSKKSLKRQKADERPEKADVSQDT